MDYEPAGFTTTTWIIIVTVCVWVLWDVYAYVTKNDKTFSVVIRGFGFYSPPFVFLCGFLAGHFFW